MEDFYIPGPTVPGTIQVEFYGLKLQRKNLEIMIRTSLNHLFFLT